MIKHCVICGKEFTPKTSRQLCCSADCSDKHRAHLRRILRQRSPVHEIKHCVICGKEFTPKTSRQLCCSADCSDKHRAHLNQRNQRNKQAREVKKKNKKKHTSLLKTFRCLACGKEFNQHFPHEKFCSDDCRFKWFSLGDQIIFFKLAKGEKR